MPRRERLRPGDGPLLGPGGRVVGVAVGAGGAPVAQVRLAGGAVVPLALPPGASAPEVRGVGAAGHVFGAVSVAGERQGFVTAPDGAVSAHPGVTLFGVAADGALLGVGPDGAFVRSAAGAVAPLGADFEPVALNGDGVAVGVAPSGVGPLHAWRWTAAGGLEDLGALGGDAWPTAVSAAGVVVGTSLDATGARRAWRWTEDDGLEALGALPGQAASEAWAVNAAGEVAGGSGSAFRASGPERRCVLCEADTEAPRLVCPVAEAVAECAGALTAVPLGGPVASDACGWPVALSDDRREGYPLGESTVTFTGTDAAGLGASCATRVSVVDTVAPVVSCPAALALESEGDVCGAALALPVTAVDACAGADAVAVTSDLPALLPLGETVVEAVATDPSGNAASCSFTVTVSDASALSLSCPEAFAVTLPEDACATAQTVRATLASVCTPALGAPEVTRTLGPGVTAVAVEADGREGARLRCETAVTVVDATPPTVGCGAPAAAVPWGAWPVVAEAEAEDACGATLALEGVRCVGTDAAGAEVALDLTTCGVSVEGGVLTVAPPSAADAAEAAGALSRGFAVRWTARATDPSAQTATAECALAVAAAPEPEPPTDDLIATGGGGCAGGGTGAGLLAALAALAAFAAVRRRAR